MDKTLPQRRELVDGDRLALLLRRQFQTDTPAVTEWTTTQLHGGTFGVVTRFAGTARNGATTVPWSLIRKVVHNHADLYLDRSKPANSRYWRREAFAYQSGFLTDLPGDLVAPRCYGIESTGDDEIWLWLEDVASAPQEQWTAERFALAARHFGHFNGHYLTAGPLPTAAWLGRQLLRAVTAEVRAAVERLPTVQDHLLVRRFFPPDIVAAIGQLWDEREAFLAVAEALPQTICHRDANRRNLFARTTAAGHIQTVAIDWEDVAIAGVGEELAALIVLGPALRQIAVGEAASFDQLLFTAYLAGLAESGWQGEPELVRLGYTTACLRFSLALPAIFLDLALDEGRHAALAAREGQSVTAFADHWAAIQRFLFARINEARGLMKQLC